MPRKPTLSPSKITTYLACPSKYRWTYVDERGRWYLRAKKYYSFGTTLHKVLQRFHDEGDQGVTTTAEALAAMEESWIEAGYSSAQEMQEAMSEGKAILTAYTERELMRPSPGRAILIEKQLRMDLGPFVLIGRVDRVDEHPDGALEVVDYKSGRQAVTVEDVESDLAMACYQLLVENAYPERAVSLSIHAVRSDTKATYSHSAADLAQFRSDLVQLGEEILHRDYERLAPTYKDLCAYCDFLPLCRQHPDWEEPEAEKSPQPS